MSLAPIHAQNFFIVLRFLRKEARLSQDFNVVGSSFQMMGAATEKVQ